MARTPSSGSFWRVEDDKKKTSTKNTTKTSSTGTLKSPSSGSFRPLRDSTIDSATSGMPGVVGDAIEKGLQSGAEDRGIEQDASSPSGYSTPTTRNREEPPVEESTMFDVSGFQARIDDMQANFQRQLADMQSKHQKELQDFTSKMSAQREDFDRQILEKQRAREQAKKQRALEAKRKRDYLQRGAQKGNVQGSLQASPLPFVPRDSELYQDTLDKLPPGVEEMMIDELSPYLEEGVPGAISRFLAKDVWSQDR